MRTSSPLLMSTDVEAACDVGTSSSFDIRRSWGLSLRQFLRLSFGGVDGFKCNDGLLVNELKVDVFETGTGGGGTAFPLAVTLWLDFRVDGVLLPAPSVILLPISEIESSTI